MPTALPPRNPDLEERDLLTAVAASIDHVGNQRKRQITNQMRGTLVQFASTRVVDLDGDWSYVVVSGKLHGPVQVTLMNDNGDPRHELTVESHWWPGQPLWEGAIDGVRTNVQVRPILNGFDLTHRGIHMPVYVYTEREAKLARLMPEIELPDTSKMLLCPMPGRVVSIMVEEGQEVKAGEPLCIIEAMKMENILRAARDCVVEKINAAPEDVLAVDAVIMEFE